MIARRSGSSPVVPILPADFDPPKGHAGDPDDGRGMRLVDARAMARGTATALPDNALKIVARGEAKEDQAAAA